MNIIKQQTLLIGLLLINTFSFSQTKEITGAWQGQLIIQGTPLKILLHIVKEKESYNGSFDSPDQGAFGIPFSTVTYNDALLVCEIPKMQLKIVGSIMPSDSLSVKWQQGPANLPITFYKLNSDTKLSRPQEPKGDLPYIVKEVTFKNTIKNINLHGTLTLPVGKGPFPAVVLISGSGPQDRNSEVFGHKPFLVLADFLTRHGIAVLRYDDRGTGQSEGNFADATSLDFAEDAEFAFAFLYSEDKIDRKKTGLLGHSEGGMIAPMIAARNKKVAFEVMVAGPAVPIDSLMYDQLRLVFKSGMASDESLKKQLAINHRLFNYLKSKPDYPSAKSGLDTFVHETLLQQMSHDTLGFYREFEIAKRQIHAQVTPWFYYFINYNPMDNLSKITQATLAIYGGKDVQVEALSNAVILTSIFSKSKLNNFTVHTFPNLNHLMQTANTGAINEYVKIDETFSEEALKMIAEWILALK